MKPIAEQFYHTIFGDLRSSVIWYTFETMLINLLFTSPLIFIILVLALLFSLSLHEFAHAYVAFKQGDPTAKHMGRLTLNPLAHLDPLGSLLLLFAGFGWAKPVPVNPLNMRDPKKGFALVAIAGPGMNFILAATSCLLLKVPGFKFVSGMLPADLSWQWEQLAPYGIFILIFLISTNAFAKILLPLMQGFLAFFGM